MEPDYKGAQLLAVAVGTTVRVWDASSSEERPEGDRSHTRSHTLDPSTTSAVMAKANVSPTAISWNRNNKVAAVGLENGRVQIRYANGACMSTLEDDVENPQPVTSLSWSTGSKSLAVGTAGGRVAVHDMTSKQRVTKVISSPAANAKLKAVGLEHHPDDAFLAVGGMGSVELYSLRLEEAKMSCVCSASAVVKNDACFSSVSVAAGKTYLAAGSDKNGIVAVWDYATGSELACDKFRHAHKGSTKVALAPLEPYLLYSVGMDGILKMQDLRAPSSIASPTAMASVSSTAGIASMSVHEYSGDIALGTNDGYVYVFAGGLRSRQPKHSLFFGEELAARDEECPVLAVDWARSYHNVTLHARQAVVESDRLAATPVRAVANARLTTPVAAVEKGEDRHEDDREDKHEGRHEDKHEEKQTATPSTSSATPNTTNARSTTPNAVDESANAVDPSPLVRRTSTADPWRIRAATVVDGDANTPSSSAGPARTPRQVPPVDVKKAVVETELARPGPVDVSHEVQEELSQLILALHLDVVQMHEASSAEIRALRQEVAALKELLECQAKPSGDVWGI